MMIRRILHFQTHDWKHIFWLVQQILRGYWNGDLEAMISAWFWIRFHFEYDSTLVQEAK